MKTNPQLRDHDAAVHAGGFDDTDPHGAGASQGAHHHVSRAMLRFVLVVLLAFTVLTVGAAQFEVWVQDYFNILLPQWVNLLVAMSIAVVKGVLVVLFFMQLKYDNPINGVIFLFTLLGVGLFLGFTLLDLGSRDAIYDYKARQVIPGGTSNTLVRTGADGKPEAMTSNMSIVQYAREKKLKEVGEKEFARLEAEAHAHGHHAKHDHGPSNSDAQRSRPRTGISDALGAVQPAAHDEHGPADKGHAEPADAPKNRSAPAAH